MIKEGQEEKSNEGRWKREYQYYMMANNSFIQESKGPEYYLKNK